MSLVVLTGAVYGVTLLLVEAKILAGVRRYLRDKAPWLTAGGVFLFDCRMCTGFWVSLIAVLLKGADIALWLFLFGASYFLATQER